MNAQVMNETARRSPGVGTPVWLLLAAVALAVLFLVDPAEWKIFPPCLFHKLTGWQCPGCGATRAVHALLHGRLAAAFRDNALLVLSLPVLAAYVWVRAMRRRQGRPSARLSPTWLWVALGVGLVFMVWRNLPSGAWLSP